MEAPLQSNARVVVKREARLFVVSPEEKEKYRKRFWSRVDIKGPKECWRWTGGVGNYEEGYGRFGIGDGNMGISHRVAWVLHYNMLIPKDLLVCHSCDNPACCNPTHLFLATVAVNMKDRDLKGRCPVLKGKWRKCSISIEDKKGIALDYIQRNLRICDIATNRSIGYRAVKSSLRSTLTKIEDKSWLPESLRTRYAHCKSWEEVLEAKCKHGYEDASSKNEGTQPL
jgi:hypothetical protein